MGLNTSSAGAAFTYDANNSITGLAGPGGIPIQLSQANLYPMRKWSAALGKMRNGTRNAKLLVLGDSTMAGAGATGVGGFGAGGMPKSMCMYLGKELNRIYGAANAHGFFGEGMRGGTLADGASGTVATDAAFDPRLVFGGADWVRQLIDSGLGGPFFKNGTGTTSFDFTPTAVGSYSANIDTFVVWYVTTSTAGSFSYGVDAVAPTTQSCVTGSNGVASRTVPCGSLGAHTLNLKRVSGNIWIMGIQAYDSTVKQVEVLVAPWNGGFTSNFIATGAPWSAGSFIPTLAPDLTIIQLQINDAAFATPLATYIANMQSLITKCLTPGDVILRSGYPSAITYNADTTLAKQTVYRDALAALAATNNIPFDDLFGRLGSYEIQQAVPGGGMYADTLHPSGPLYGTAAYSLAKLLRDY